MPGGEQSPTWLRIGGDGEWLWNTTVLHGPFLEAPFPSSFIFSLRANVKDNDICGGIDDPLAHLSLIMLLLVKWEWSLRVLAICLNVGEHLPSSIICRIIFTYQNTTQEIERDSLHYKHAPERDAGFIWDPSRKSNRICKFDIQTSIKWKNKKIYLGTFTTDVRILCYYLKKYGQT